MKQPKNYHRVPHDPKHGEYSRHLDSTWCEDCMDWISSDLQGFPTQGHGRTLQGVFICDTQNLKQQKKFAEQELKDANADLADVNKLTAAPVLPPASTPIQDVLKERGSRYGTFMGQAGITQNLKGVMQASKKGEAWCHLAADQKEALAMIAHKIARILNGDPNYIDSWIDIAGYAQLVVNRLVEDADKDK
jgi:hypothetical protein